jgi:uracil-DNA glycosylase family 4
MNAAESVTPDERRRALEQIAAEVSVCTRCPLHVGRTLAVPGEGHPDTEVVFIGEGPGYNEDQQGRPFVGAAGTLLNELLRQIGWKRQDVFITNVVKCRPPGNRDPEAFEIEACAPYLKRQLEVLDPAVVVTLGRHSLGYFNPGARIGATHGTQHPVDPATGAPSATLYAMYHPAAALRQGSLKQTMIEDMCGLPDALLGSRARRSGIAVEPQPEAAPRETAPPDMALTAAAPSHATPTETVIDVEPELVAVAIAQMPDSSSPADPFGELPPIDENQMALF